MTDEGRKRIENYSDLNVYRNAFSGAMTIFELSKSFPIEERYSLVDQLRRSSRSVCANIAEAWRKRRYSAHFVSKLSDAESEAEETRVWLSFAKTCGYASNEVIEELDRSYDQILAQLVTMIAGPKNWSLPPASQRARLRPASKA